MFVPWPSVFSWRDPRQRLVSARKCADTNRIVGLVGFLPACLKTRETSRAHADNTLSC